MAEHSNPLTRYQPERIPRRLPLKLGAGLAAGLVLALAILALVFPASLHPTAEGPRGPLPPAPRLVTDETAELRQLRAAEEQRLASYGWVDRGAGLVHIPIDEAMRRIAEQGITTWPAR
jgi:hypothetical protein